MNSIYLNINQSLLILILKREQLYFLFIILGNSLMKSKMLNLGNLKLQETLSPGLTVK